MNLLVLFSRTNYILVPHTYFLHLVLHNFNVFIQTLYWWSYKWSLKWLPIISHAFTIVRFIPLFSFLDKLSIDLGEHFVFLLWMKPLSLERINTQVSANYFDLKISLLLLRYKLGTHHLQLNFIKIFRFFSCGCFNLGVLVLSDRTHCVAQTVLKVTM